MCGHRACLIADRDGVYDPGTPNGRLLLDLKGTISELELHTIRGRLTAGLLAKAERGELALQLPTGFVRDPSGVVTKDPNREVQERIALLFESFLSVRTAVKATRTLAVRGLALPCRDRYGEVCWRRPTIPAVTDMLKKSGLCRRLRLWSHAPEAIEPTGRTANQDSIGLGDNLQIRKAAFTGGVQKAGYTAF